MPTWCAARWTSSKASGPPFSIEMRRRTRVARIAAPPGSVPWPASWSAARTPRRSSPASRLRARGPGGALESTVPNSRRTRPGLGVVEQVFEMGRVRAVDHVIRRMRRGGGERPELLGVICLRLAPGHDVVGVVAETRAPVRVGPPCRALEALLAKHSVRHSPSRLQTWPHPQSSLLSHGAQTAWPISV